MYCTVLTVNALQCTYRYVRGRKPFQLTLVVTPIPKTPLPSSKEGLVRSHPWLPLSPPLPTGIYKAFSGFDFKEEEGEPDR